jgi:hypothetical protein
MNILSPALYLLWGVRTQSSARRCGFAPTFGESGRPTKCAGRLSTPRQLRRGFSLQSLSRSGAHRQVGLRCENPAAWMSSCLRRDAVARYFGFSKQCANSGGYLRRRCRTTKITRVKGRVSSDRFNCLHYALCGVRFAKMLEQHHD